MMLYILLDGIPLGFTEEITNLLLIQLSEHRLFSSRNYLLCGN